MRLNEVTKAVKDIFKGKVISLHVDEVELENGKIATREVVEHSGGVCVIPVTTENEMIFVRQFRYPYKEVLLEAPAGKLEKGEDPFEAVKREQMEETGTYGKDYISLGKLYPSPGYCSEVIYLWLCHVDGMGKMNPDEDEFLEVEKIPVKRAVEMVYNNEIADAKTQVVVLKAARSLNIN